MTVTAKEEREIIAECKKSADDGTVEAASSVDRAESTDDTEGGASQPPIATLDIKCIVDQCLDEKLSPLADAIKSASESAAQGAHDVQKVLDIYNLMTECRNKATLLLTKHIEMYERLKGLADFCRENIGENAVEDSFLKSLLTRTGNIERVANRTLGSFGVMPIWPARNDAFDENLHQIISEVDASQTDDKPGAVAECLKMGTVRDGVVAKAAEVVIFRNHVDSSEKTVG